MSKFFMAFVLLLSLSSEALALKPTPIYMGALGGYGATTWKGLVPDEEHLNLATSLSAPIDTSEGGGMWGFFLGYEVTPAFALEMSYFNYAKADITFDESSLFSMDHEEKTTFNTKTQSYQIMAKFMVPVPSSRFRIYSSVGIANVFRKDLILDTSRVSPTFGVGLNYRFGEHFMTEIGGNFTVGYGEAQLNPTDTYFPFLYSAALRLGYQF